MICPFCQSGTKIYNSRATHGKTQTWRRHRCIQNNHTFTTRESIDLSGATTVESDTKKAPYNPERLLISLVRAANNLTLPDGTLYELATSIELQLQADGFFSSKNRPASLITTTATTVLARYSPNMALQYVNNVHRNNPPLEVIQALVTPQNSL